MTAPASRLNFWLSQSVRESGCLRDWWGSPRGGLFALWPTRAQGFVVQLQGRGGWVSFPGQSRHLVAQLHAHRSLFQITDDMYSTSMEQHWGYCERVWGKGRTTPRNLTEPLQQWADIRNRIFGIQKASRKCLGWRVTRRYQSYVKFYDTAA